MTENRGVLGKPPEARQQHEPFSEPFPHTEPQSSEAGHSDLAISVSSTPNNLQVPFLQ